MYTKTIKDYYEIMYEKFPDVPKKDIRTILNYGWKAFYLYNSYGADVQTHSKNFNLYCGDLTKNSLRHFRYYLRKLLVKARIVFKQKCKEWDRYYYFALTDRQYNTYLSQFKKRGRPKKHISYGNQVLYKNPDENKIANWNRKYIFRVPSLIDRGYSFYKENFMSDEAELIEIKDSIKFDSILTQNNNFKYI